MRYSGTLLPFSLLCVSLSMPAGAAAQWSEVYSLTRLSHVGAPAVRPDGTLLVPDPFRNRVLGITPDGIAHRIAGTGVRATAGDGGPAARAHIDAPTAVAVLPDGGYVIADGGGWPGRIRRVSAAGVIATVAGGGARFGDGGPALEARLDGVSALAVAADGSILIGGGARVRRVDPQGVIRTVAGTGDDRNGGDGGPATQAQIGDPHSLLPLPDGGFLMAADGRVRRVDSQGTITTVPPEPIAPGTALGFTTAIGALDAGAFLLADRDGVLHRADASGSLATLLDRGAIEDFSGRGFAPSTSAAGIPIGIAKTPDGGLIFNSSSDLAYAAPAQPARTGVRIRGARVSRAAGRLRLAATHAGVATVTIRRGRRTVATPAQPVAAGRSWIAIRLPRRPGTYDVGVVLTADGRTAADRLALLIGRTLPLPLARDAYNGTVTFYDDAARRIGCRRRSARRIDCAVRYGRPARMRCDWRAAIEAGADGILRSRDYRCRARPPASPLRGARLLWPSP